MEHDCLLGIITDGDIRRLLADKGANSLLMTADQIMTKNPKTILESTFLAKAEEEMKSLHVHSLVVMNEENRVVGIFEFSN